MSERTYAYSCAIYLHSTLAEARPVAKALWHYHDALRRGRHDAFARGLFLDAVDKCARAVLARFLAPSEAVASARERRHSTAARILADLLEHETWLTAESVRVGLTDDEALALHCAGLRELDDFVAVDEGQVSRLGVRPEAATALVQAAQAELYDGVDGGAR